MNKIANFPGKYIQGPGAVQNLDKLINKFGTKALFISSKTAKNFIPESLFTKELSLHITFADFGGECSEELIQPLLEKTKSLASQIIVGMGGGKVIDTAKIVADRAGLPVIIVPTIASTDAPCSGCAVTYTPEGEFERVHYQRLNPALVLVDTDIIAKAPVRFLVAGMGDALATWFEARSCSSTNSVNECGGLSTNAGQQIAKLCYQILLADGAQAKQDHLKGIISQSLQNVIEANILLSGIGFESGGLATAHAIHNGMTVLEETHSFYHGEKVAFGVLTGLHLNMAGSEEIKRVYTFCKSVGLPLTLSDIGIQNIKRDYLLPLAVKACEAGSSIHHEENKITVEMIIDALIKADKYGRSFYS